MRRPPASIVVLAWNAWDATRACLESLRPTLGVHDQVVVVDNGSTDATAQQLARFPWVEVVTNEENRGFAGGCNDGAAAARHGHLVFLNNDTLLAGRWLDALVAPFDDDSVGAAGPRSNFVSGPQVVPEATYAPGDMGALRRFARAWAEDHRGLVGDTDRLVGFCLAVRRDVFEQVGGFDESYGIGGYEDDDLCRRILETGHRLVIAHESFVHHDGHRTFDANGLDWFAEQESNRDRFAARHLRSAPAGTPLVSGCLITKDEAENITVCLESLTDLCDEIVVYDTGSSDDTVAIARQAGAVVVEGYWDDDFSRARNAALAHCRGEWIAWLDADETLETPDVGGLRSLLARGERSVDGYAVPIDNLTGTGAGATFVHSACRLFRRAACEWVGRLHEQVARREDHRGINQATQDLARIRHTGYLESVMQARDKVERNLRLASAEVEHAAGWDKGFSLTSLGRSYLTAGRLDEAFVHCRDALAHTDNPIIRRLALRSAAEALFAAGRLDEALEWSARLRAESTKPVLADLLEAKIRLARGEFRSALALFDTVGACSVDDDGFEHAAHMYAASRAEALAGLGRPAEAADALLGALFEHGVLDTHLGAVIEFLELGGRPLTELALAIPADKAPIFFAQLLQLQPHAADAVLEACLECHGDPLPVLATAATLSRRLPVERTLAWSARMREAGLSDACPLVALARGDRSPVDRARAAAVAVAAFGDERARPAFALALEDASIAERATIEAETAAICPTLLPAPLPPPQQSDPSSASVSGPASSAPWPSARVAGEMPRVSVVIPCFDRAALTLRCLESLGAHTDPGAYDVILVDNGSTDATVELAGSQSESFRVVRNDHNTGFGPACNQGAALARGQYVLFLNNDTEVLPGWLEPLVAALDEDEDLGAVQPKLLYPDGRLNDAGGLVFAGGAPWVYGKGHPDPADPRFDCRRAPDYASGACLLVRRAAFEEVGGFDDRYAPAYFEDTDLSFALRDRGWSVLYEPASTVVHVEGGTAGTDVGSGLKQYQVRNATRFADKWAAELATRPALDPATVDSWAHRPQGGFGPGERRRVPRGPGAWDDACADAERAKSILVIDPFMPVFDRASGSLRLFTLLRTLREAGHAVTFLPTAGGDRRYARAVGNFGVLCFGAPPETLAAWPEAVVRRYFPLVVDLLAATHFDVVVLSPWKVGELLLRDVRAAAPDALVVLDTNDVHFRRLERELALGAGSLDGRAVADEKARELAVYRQADRIVCVTEDDVAAVRAEIPGIDGVVLPNAHGLVDPGPGFDERGGAVFVGNFNHPPNADAVSWWKSEIAPLLAHRLPGVGLTVVGNDPAGVAATMAGGGVTVTGAVHSTLPHLHAARVSVAPLRYGAGMKGKVGEALAAGLPVVLTSVAAEGMALVDGRHALVADTPEEFAAAVARLHTDPELWTRLRDAGRAHVDAHLGLGRMRDGLETVLAPAGRPARGPNRQARRQARRTGGSVATPAPPTLPAPPAAPAAPAQAGPAPDAGIETPARPVTICLAMNTRNEETRVEHAIASCPGVDEIVVADMESTDGTVERARGAGARVLTLPNAGYCEPGRQPLLDAVESTWALVLDADEQLRPGGIDALRALVQGAPADVSAYRIPRVTMCGPTEVRGSGWGTGVERHPRFVRCRDVTWPSTIHAVPSFTGTVAELPDGSDVEILHQNFDDLEHALEKFNRYSGIEAAERLALGERPTWRDALADAVDECTARYQPEVDGGLSLALAFGLFSYRLGVHLKTLESAGELRDAPVPRAESMRAAWAAFWDVLRREEIAATRAEIGEDLAAGRHAEAAGSLAGLAALWGAAPDVLLEAAVVSAHVGSIDDAMGLVDQALAIDPRHPEARATKLGLEVATGVRPPVTAIAIGRDLVPAPDEIGVGLPGSAHGALEAPLHDLPFAPASLDRIRVSEATIGGLPSDERARVVTHLRGLLRARGRVEVDGARARRADELAVDLRAGGLLPRATADGLVATLGTEGTGHATGDDGVVFHEEWYPDGQLAELCGLLDATLTRAVDGAIVEIGCWEGRSTVALARVLEPSGRRLHAVDWWLGNVDEGTDHATVHALHERDVFATFTANVAPYRCVDVHRQDGRDFLTGMPPGEGIAFVHLDAGHTYEATKQLIDLALPRLAHGGVICGDDFENSHAGRHDLGGGVEGAVRDALRGDGRNIGNLWYYQRPVDADPPWWAAATVAGVHDPAAS